MKISFQGNPYRIPKALVYPIKQDINPRLIGYISRQANGDNYIAEGVNGRVFHLGSDRVVKKSKADAYFSKDVIPEAKKLDFLEAFRSETGFSLGNTQRGIVAFQFNNGESYLVSTLVNGKKPNSLTNPFNQKNLADLINIFTEMDIGSPSKGRLLAYDYNLGNINITHSNAGLLDLEYVKGCKTDESIEKFVLTNHRTFHSSDTSAMESNIRSFEFTGFYDYLQTLPKKEAKKLFEYYLHLKGEYHKKMGKFFSQYSSKSSYPEIVTEISEAEIIHSKFLLMKHIPTDIIEAEARKIQAVNFQFASWNKCINLEINPNQIKRYYSKNIEYFSRQLQKAIKNNDSERIVYYKNAVERIEACKPSEVTTTNQSSRVTNRLTPTLETIVI